LIGLFQWWASVTFGLIALAHFGRKSLNLPLVVVDLGLYVAFSAWLSHLTSARQAELDNLRADLMALASDSYQLSQTSLSTEAVNSTALWLGSAAIFGAFFASIGYFVWAYVRNGLNKQAARD
jgi:hypothetical protein